MTNRALIAVAIVAVVSVAAFASSRVEAQLPDCVSGGAVPANAGLVKDCETLLNLMDDLRGSASLNWSETTPIGSWTGVRLGGSPQRVTIVKLQKGGLNGSIPAEIGSLDKLVDLWLYINELSGPLPAELSNLSDLETLMLANNNLSGQIPEALNDLTLNRLWLKGNNFTGCVPYNLTLVPDNDLSRVSLPACAPPGDTPPTPTRTPQPGATPVPSTPTPGPPPSDGRLTAIEERLNAIEGKVAKLEADMARLMATPTPGPSQTPGPTATPTPVPSLGTQQQPVPFGTPFTFRNSSTDHWEVTVLETTPNATRAILNENRFNDPPESGNQFYMVKVKAKYLGADSERFSGFYRLRALGDEGVVYTTFGNSCGVIPDDLPDPELFTGGEIEGNECWEIDSSDADSLVLLVDPDISSRGQRVWFSLTSP